MIARDIVRTHDRDRYLANLFAPTDLQPDLFALHAFNAEIVRIRDVVSEPQLGEIRLQWWSDTLETMVLGAAQDNPLAAELARTVARHKLPMPTLQRLVEVHRADFYADRQASLNDLEGYLGETESAIFQLSALILGADPRATAEVSGLFGVAYGIAKLMAASERNAAFIPEGQTPQALRQHAKRRLSEARALELPTALLPGFLPAALTELYVAYEGKPVPSWRRQWRIWRAAGKEVV